MSVEERAALDREAAVEREAVRRRGDEQEQLLIRERELATV